MNQKYFLKNTTYAIAWIVLISTALIQGSFFSNLVYEYRALCPNKDVLSWDANLRLIGVMDQINDLKRGEILQGLFPFLDAPTWPPLRAFISLLGQSITPGPVDQNVEVYIGTLFMALTIATLLYASIRISRSLIRGALLWFFLSTILWYTFEFPAYAMSAMLETQGMFFSILGVYFLYRFYEEVHRSRDRQGLEQFTGIHRLINEKYDSQQMRSLDSTIKAGLMISITGVFFTKYPYGIILILSLVGYEILTALPNFISIFLYMLNKRYVGIRRIIPILLFLVLILFGLSGMIESVTGLDMHSRGVKNFAWLVLVIFFIDFNFFLKKEKENLEKIVPTKLLTLYAWGILPSMVWLLIHPSRVLSILSTQQHQQDASRLFMESFFTDIFSIPFIPILTVLIILPGMLMLLFYEWNGRHPAPDTKGRVSVLRIVETEGEVALRRPGFSGLIRFLRDPVSAITVIVFLQFLVLELTTSNKQLRHIYHLIPSMLFISGLWFMRISFLIRLSQKWKKTRGAIDFVSTVGAGMFTVYLLTMPGGLLSREYFSQREICYTGKDPSIFEPARDLARSIDSQYNYILINAFHNTQIEARNRRIASDFDLLLRTSREGASFVYNDNQYSVSSWKPFDRLLVLESECKTSYSFELLKDRIVRYNIELTEENVIHRPEYGYCATVYSISHNKDHK